MDRERDEEKRLGDDIDAMTKGTPPEPGTGAEDEYRQMIEFAGRMLQSRTEPSPAFASDLRRRLLQKMTDAEMEDERAAATRRSFWDMVRGLAPRSPAWRTVSVTIAVLVVALVVAWRAGAIFGPAKPPLVGSPPPPGTVSPSPVSVTAVASGTTFTVGQDIGVTFTFTNTASEPLTLSTFPPQVLIAAPSLRPYRNIPGGGPRTLSPGETIEWTFTWDQRDDAGEQVPPGEYVIEMLDIELAGGAGTVSLAETPHVSIAP